MFLISCAEGVQEYWAHMWLSVDLPRQHDVNPQMFQNLMKLYARPWL